MGGRGKKKAKIRDQDSLQGFRTNKNPGTVAGSQNKTTGYLGTFKFVIQIGVELTDSGKSSDFHIHTDVYMHLSNFTIKKKQTENPEYIFQLIRNPHFYKNFSLSIYFFLP